MNVYDFEYTSIDGKLIKMSEYKGKVLLLVNTASKCGFTPQYEGLQKLYEKYKDQGFIVIGFPSNQFLEQEPGTEEEISNFCSARYGVTFPLSKKVDVRGKNAILLFKYLISMKKFEGLFNGEKAEFMENFLKDTYKDNYNDPQIKWNFTKFLVDRQGNVFGRYESTVDPNDLEKDIETLLN